MKALTLWQPWASLIACGAKAHETRSWRWPGAGPLLIHAASKWNREMEALVYTEPYMGALGIGAALPSGISGGRRELVRPLPLGAIVAVAHLMGCKPTDEQLLMTRAVPASEADRRFGDWRPGRWAWELADVQRLIEPIPCPGMQGLWESGSDLERRVMKARKETVTR